MTRTTLGLVSVALLLSASVSAQGQQTSGSIGSLLFPGLPAAAPPANSAPPPANGPAGTNTPATDPTVTNPLPAHSSPVDSLSTNSPTVNSPAVNSASTGPAVPDRPARARPLFSATRRPPPVPVVLAVQPPTPVVAPPRPAPDLRLIGVVDRTEKAVAFLRRAGTDKTLAMQVGDRVEDWVVGAIETKRIVLRDGQREQAYVLFARSPVPSRALGPAGQSHLPQPGRKPD